MPSVYPSSDLDRQTTPRNLLGSWFGRDSQEFQQPLALVDGLLRLFRDVDGLRDFLSLLADRRTVPLSLPGGILPLRLRASESDGSAAIPRFGEGFQYGSGIQYGRPVRLASARFPLPVAFQRIGLLVDRPLTQSVCWFPGLDFLWEDDRILFRRNPFEDSRLRPEPVWADGEIVDQELTLWVVDGRQDQLDVQNRYGFVTGLNASSTRAYRAFVNAVWDAWTYGASIEALQRIVSAIADAPVAEGAETVEMVTVDRQGRLIVTDRNVYHAAESASPIVAVGDVVVPGQPLTDSASVLRVSGFESVSSLRGLSLDAGWLAPGFLSAISFDNRDVPTEISREDGKLVVRFELGGWPGDVDRFWELMHERGLAAGATLANLLDPRANPVGEPFESAMPTTVNPLRFVADNVLRNRALVVRLRPIGFGPDALPPHFMQIVRAVVPPWHGVLVILELELEGDEITMDGPGDESQPGVAEGPLAAYDLTGAADTADPTSLIVESPRLRDIDGICL